MSIPLDFDTDLFFKTRALRILDESGQPTGEYAVGKYEPNTGRMPIRVCSTDHHHTTAQEAQDCTDHARLYGWHWAGGITGARPELRQTSPFPGPDPQDPNYVRFELPADA